MSLVLNPVYNVLLYLLVHIFLFFLSVISISTLSLSISVTSFLLVYRHMLFSYSSLVYLLYAYICLHHVFFFFNPKLHIFLFSLSCIAISTLSVSISVTTYLLVYRYRLVSYSSLIFLHPHLLLPNRRHALIPVHWIIQPHFPFWSIITLSFLHVLSPFRCLLSFFRVSRYLVLSFHPLFAEVIPRFIIFNLSLFVLVSYCHCVSFCVCCMFLMYHVWSLIPLSIPLSQLSRFIFSSPRPSLFRSLTYSSQFSLPLSSAASAAPSFPCLASLEAHKAWQNPKSSPLCPSYN